MTTISRAAKVFSYILQILPKLNGNDVKMNAVKRIRFWTSAKCTLSFSVNGNNDFGYLHLLYVIKVLELDILQVSTRANHYGTSVFLKDTKIYFQLDFMFLHFYRNIYTIYLNINWFCISFQDWHSREFMTRILLNSVFQSKPKSIS